MSLSPTPRTTEPIVEWSFGFQRCVQDVGLPFMTSPQHHEDTLFLVFEEDWRLFPDDKTPAVMDDPVDTTGTDFDTRRPDPGLATESNAVPLRRRREMRRPTGHADDGVPTACGLTRAQRRADPDRPPPSRDTFAGVGWYTPAAAGGDGRSTYAYDLVSFANAAAKLRPARELVWMTWQPGQEAKPKPINCIRSGAMLLSVSRKAAMQLRTAVNDGVITEGHWDCRLLAYLREHSSDSWCYLNPPVGNYFEHLSGCERTFADTARPSCWTFSWTCPGTRRGHDEQRRDKWFCVMRHKAPMEWIREVDLDKEHLLDWYTFWDVADLPKGKGKGQHPATAADTAPEPNARGKTVAAASSSSAAPAATAAGSDSESETMTRRAKRRARRYRARWTNRNWVEIREQAGCHQPVLETGAPIRGHTIFLC